MNEGYVKFNCEQIDGNPPELRYIKDLNRWRTILYKRNLIGSYPDGTGFGNVSFRPDIKSNEFIITGTQTGNFETLEPNQFTRIIDYDINKNYVKCIGKIKASSETMTHAAIYKILTDINAVFHIHSINLWNKLLYNIPTTNKNAEYGSPEMANEIIFLLNNSDLPNLKILAMAGHEEGIVTFGSTIDEAGNTLLKYL